MFQRCRQAPVVALPTLLSLPFLALPQCPPNDSRVIDYTAQGCRLGMEGASDLALSLSTLESSAVFQCP